MSSGPRRAASGEVDGESLPTISSSPPPERSRVCARSPPTHELAHGRSRSDPTQQIIALSTQHGARPSWRYRDAAGARLDPCRHDAGGRGGRLTSPCLQPARGPAPPGVGGPRPSGLARHALPGHAVAARAARGPAGAARERRGGHPEPSRRHERTNVDRDPPPSAAASTIPSRRRLVASSTYSSPQLSHTSAGTPLTITVV
jgi:hypothetical protein